jgi:hypothetical protein
MQHINGVLFVGVGGTGSHALPPIAALLSTHTSFEGTVTVCDGDAFEEKNLKNQCITPDDVGVNKAEWGCGLIHRIVDVDLWDEYLEGPAKVQGWLAKQQTDQRKRREADQAPGVAVIFTPVDNAHARWFIFDAVEQTPQCNVLIINPGNGTVGDNPDQVDCISYLRVWDPDEETTIEPWPSIVAKLPKYREPEGQNPKTGCQEKAEGAPQLRTSNMRGAVYIYDFFERFVMDRGMPEARRYDDEYGERDYGTYLPTADEQTQLLEM